MDGAMATLIGMQCEVLHDPTVDRTGNAAFLCICSCRGLLVDGAPALHDANAARWYTREAAALLSEAVREEIRIVIAEKR